MAFINSTTYTGKDALEFYSAAILTGNTAKNVRVLPDVKSSIKMPKVSIGDLLQADGCSFNASGDVTLEQKTVTVCALKVNMELCTIPFEQTFLSEQLRAGSNNNEIPSSFNTYMLGEVAKKVNNQIENLFWNGDTDASPEDLCDGIFKKLSEDEDVVGVTGTTLSSSNIITEMTKVYDAIPAVVYKGIAEGTLKWFISIKAEKLYKAAIAAASAEAYYTKSADLNFLGIPLTVVNNMPDDKMLVASQNNIWMATDLVSDFEDVKIIDMYETTGSKTFRFVAGMKLAADYGVAEEIVAYGAEFS
jgi:hypothetical protein